MRKTVLCSMTALAAGLLLGLLLGTGLSPTSSAPSQSVAAASPMRNSMLTASPAPQESLDPLDNPHLVARAGQILEALKEEDYDTLASFVHPESGVSLTPYSTVSISGDRTLSPSQIRQIPEDDGLYVWGTMDGSGTPIRLTVADYFARYVFNTDYTQAPQISVDKVLSAGNALENVETAYPDARFVEYYYSGIDPAMNGYDWCSLKVVLQPYENEWCLVGLVHSEWTI